MILAAQAGERRRFFTPDGRYPQMRFSDPNELLAVAGWWAISSLTARGPGLHSAV